MSIAGDMYRRGAADRAAGKMLWDLIKTLGSAAGIMAKEKAKQIGSTALTVGLEEGKKLVGRQAAKAAITAAAGYLGKDTIEKAVELLTSNDKKDLEKADELIKGIMEIGDNPSTEAVTALIKKAISRDEEDDQVKPLAEVGLEKEAKIMSDMGLKKEVEALKDAIVEESKAKEAVIAGDTTVDDAQKDIKAQAQKDEENKKKEEEKKIHNLLLKMAVKADKAVLYPSYLDKAETLVDMKKRTAWKDYQYNPIAGGIVYSGQSYVNPVFGKAGF